MQEQIANRLLQLQEEYNKGQQVLADLRHQTSALEQTLQRISGAMQVLEEILSDASAKGTTAALPPTDLAPKP